MLTTSTASKLASSEVVEDSLNAPFSSPPQRSQPSRLKLTYDIVMMIAISIDLLLIGLDAIVMSTFSTNVAHWLSIEASLDGYRDILHDPIRTLGGFFTLFLIVELLVRWLLAIKGRAYYRWFFFPFVHWYEVLGCFPQLRALRLFRAFIIGKRLHQLGFQVLPQSWLNWIKFYIDLLLEELSDRVILTAIDNYRQQLTDSTLRKTLIESTISRNQDEIEAVLLQLLRTQLVPKLRALIDHDTGDDVIAREVGNAIEDGIANTPELHRLLRLIPIAGSLIESQLQSIGHNIGQNTAASLNKRLLDDKNLDPLMIAIAKGVTQVDINHGVLDNLITQIITDSLSAFEAQIKIQQWKHKDLLKF